MEVNKKKYFTSESSSFFGITAPVTYSVPLVNGQVYTLQTRVKFPDYVYTPHTMVPVLGDAYTPGFHYSFVDRNGLKIPVSKIGLFRDYFSSLSLNVTKEESAEAFWIMNYVNGRRMWNRLHAIVSISPPFGIDSNASKFVHKHIKSWDARMSYFSCLSIIQATFYKNSCCLSSIKVTFYKNSCCLST